MVYKNIVPGQFQIGDIVCGYGTNIKMENTDVKPYDINAQDYQLPRSSEVRFGSDDLKPTTIELTLEVLHNRLLPAFAGTMTNFWHSMPTLQDFARAWRNDAGRNVWGQMEPLYWCTKLDGIPKIIFGRPGQINITEDDKINGGEIVKVLAEFRRADTLSYGISENVVELLSNDTPQLLTRETGDGPDTWFRILMEGPLVHPKITIGQYEIELNYTIADGEIVEISSYPWQRRIVNSDRVNLAAKAVGKTPYLDKLSLPYMVPVPVRWTAQNVNTFVPALGNQSWQEDLQDVNFFTLPDTFDTIHGKARVGFDLFNFGTISFPFLTPRNYLTTGIFQDTTAILFNDHNFATTEQYSEGKIVQNGDGKSGIVIMSNDDMTNLVCVEVDSALSGNYLRIKAGAYNSLTEHGTAWHNTDILGWHETDVIGIGSSTTAGTTTFTAYFNGDAKVTWVDSGHIVNSANRRQGYIFDIDGNILTQGVGFTELISYDKATVGAPTGQVFLLWRDSYQVL